MIPEGVFIGTVHGPLWLQVLAKVWSGKTFTGDRVTNRILGRQMIEGRVREEYGTVYIHYPRLHLTDELVALFDDGSRWAGELHVGRWIVRFTLSRPV